MNTIFLILGSVIIFAWSVAHIIPTAAVVKGFGELSPDNRRIISMEWVAEGLALCSIGVLVLLVTLSGGAGQALGRVVFWTSAGTALVLGAWTFIAGFKTSVLPIKICPLVLTCVAVLFFLSGLW